MNSWESAKTRSAAFGIVVITIVAGGFTPVIGCSVPTAGADVSMSVLSHNENADSTVNNSVQQSQGLAVSIEENEKAIAGKTQAMNYVFGGLTSAALTNDDRKSSVTVIWTNRDHNSSVTDLALTENEEFVVAGSETPTNSLALHSAANGTVVWAKDESHPSYAVESKGNRVYYSGGSWSTTVTAFDTTGMELWNKSHDSYIYALAANDDGRLYVGEDDGNITAYDLTDGGDVLWTVQMNHSSYSPVYDIAIGQNGAIYTALGDATVRKIDPSDGRILWTFKGHHDAVRGVATDHNGNIYTASDDSTVQKLRPGGNTSWVFTGHSGGVNDIETTRGAIYTASDDTTVRKIDAKGREVWRYTGHATPVLAVAVDAGGDIYTAAATSPVQNVDGTITKLSQSSAPNTTTGQQCI